MSESERDAEGHDGEIHRTPIDMPGVDGHHSAIVPDGDGAPIRGRLMPRPDEGLSFDRALDESMRDHRAVYAALAK